MSRANLIIKNINIDLNSKGLSINYGKSSWQTINKLKFIDDKLIIEDKNKNFEITRKSSKKYVGF